MLKENFKTFCNNIELKNLEEMKDTIKKITKKLNKHYYDIEDEEEHMYIVGSVGRGTAIKNTSDLDILFDLTREIYTQYDNYQNNGQSKLLQDVKEVLLERYPNTKIKGDGQVVVISFNKYKVELVPGFKQKDETFKYPDSNNGGHWKYTDPLPEIEACICSNDDTNGNFYNVCHMLRAWKNEKGFKFKGLLIDTLINNFFKDNKDYKYVKYSSYLGLIKSIFEFLKNENPDRIYWLAIGSNQQISNDDNGNFIKKAKNAYNKLKDINENDNKVNKLLREIFGKEFPKIEENKSSEKNCCFYKNTEEFIENRFAVDIKYNLKLECDVTQDGYRTAKLSEMLKNKVMLRPKKQLKFYIKNIGDFEQIRPYRIFWKIKNEGEKAKKKDMIRGQLIETNRDIQEEHTDFRGNHYVEAYVVKDDICVSKGRIEVPIIENTGV